MNTSLLELFEVGGKNDFEFTYKIAEGEENVISLDLENKKINVLIGNPEDKNLDTDIRDVIMTIKRDS
jgi:hypothetical protein